MQVGPLASGGMSAAPISWQEMAAWVRLTGWQPSPWEAETLAQMSRSYLAEVDRSNERRVNSPMARVMSEDNRKKVAASAKMFDALIVAQKKGAGR